MPLRRAPARAAPPGRLQRALLVLHGALGPGLAAGQAPAAAVVAPALHAPVQHQAPRVAGPQAHVLVPPLPLLQPHLCRVHVLISWVSFTNCLSLQGCNVAWALHSCLCVL